ncbi:MAG: hypothetical protein K2K60_01295 [Clostridia bacterium]|nr:hypothetical protein [Clostridia bacterium]
MKYLRKIVALVIGVVFFAALVIGIGMIYAVKNINVTMVTYADDCSASYAEAKKSLSKFKGESILFVSTSDVAKAVADSNYTVASCKKKYPCTLNITLKERLETFAVASGEEEYRIYNMYDNDGKYLRGIETNANINDGSPNLILNKVSAEKIPEVAAIAGSFKEIFGSLRSLVSSINLDVNSQIDDYTEKLFFNLHSGLVIEMDDYTDSPYEKLQAAFPKFAKLTDREKLGGTLRVYRGGVEGEIRAEYSAR